MLIVVSQPIAGPLLVRYGTDDQRHRWLPGVASGKANVAFAITEPDAGTNSHRVATTGERTPSGWRLRGTKHYITGVEQAAGVIVVARTGTDERTGRGRLSIFLVETDRPFERAPIETAVIAPERQWTLFFDDLEVGEDALIGVEGDGLSQVFAGLNAERILSASVCTGLGRYALDKAIEYARDRTVWSAPIGTHQAIAHPLARAKVQLEAARLMNAQAASLYDDGGDAGEMANMAKFAAAEAVAECFDRAVQTHGGHGLSRAYGLADLWGLVRLYRIAPVSQEMILNFVAQHSLGLPRSY
jgi:alkylation response protein AidB-like acyl-CoA dehydrogenase